MYVLLQARLEGLVIAAVIVVRVYDCVVQLAGCMCCITFS